MRLILASTSPRRRQLLADAGFMFEVIEPQVDESMQGVLSPEELVRATALLKAQAVAAMVEQEQDCLNSAASSIEDALILAADTMVFVGHERLGKPCNRADAHRMMELLSGSTHDVITAVTLISSASGALHTHPDAQVHNGRCILTYHETSSVEFKALTHEEIETYLDTAHWNDKAGAYGIQEDAGGFITKVVGDFHNIMGLPISWVSNTLQTLGFTVTQPLTPQPLAHPMIINSAQANVSIYPQTGVRDTLGTPFGISLNRPPLLLILPAHLNNLTVAHTQDCSSSWTLCQGLHRIYANTHTVISVAMPEQRLDGSPLTLDHQAALVVELLDRLGVPEVRLLCDLSHHKLMDACIQRRGFRFSAAVTLDMTTLFELQRGVNDIPVQTQNRPHALSSQSLAYAQTCLTDSATQPDVCSTPPAPHAINTWGSYLSYLLTCSAPHSSEYEVISAPLVPSAHLTVRLLTESNRSEVHECYHRLLTYLEDHTNYCGWKLGLYPTCAQIDHALKSATLYGAFDDETGVLVGAASFACDTPAYYDACGWIKRAPHETMMVHMLMTDPQATRAGVARTLLAFGATLAQQRGCAELRLNTSVQNVPASRLYERLGFMRCYPLLLPYPELDIADWTCVYTLALTHP